MQLHPTTRIWRDRLIPRLHEQAWLKDVRSRFLAVSDAFADACGATPEEMIGRSETPYFSSCQVERFRTDDRRAIAWAQPIVVLEETSGVRFRTLKAPVFDESGRVAGTVGIALPDTRTRPAVARIYLGLFSPHRAQAGVRTPAWLHRVRDNLEHAFSRPVSVSSLAREVARSPNHVTRTFRQRYGVSPVEYAHRRRVEWTAHALATSALSLSAIALEAGFTDQSHMTRLFARYFGVTPGAYRDAMRHGWGDDAVRCAASEEPAAHR